VSSVHAARRQTLTPLAHRAVVAGRSSHFNLTMSPLGFFVSGGRRFKLSCIGWKDFGGWGQELTVFED